ncbi:MAG: flagellar biosynthesis protein FliQ [candidate division WS1 bacterium]|jgi:flagellar biosynthetic protein FliQ|nr:flagellar biosynthesis protein FliQ [candidate division WS1 bacterium]
MPTDIYVALARDMFIATLKLGGPLLAVALVVGTVVGILQAVTQVQEMTLTFVPKIVAMGLTVLVCGSWMLRSLAGFTEELLRRIPEYVR